MEDTVTVAAARSRPVPGPGPAGAAGLAATALALGLAELLAGALRVGASPLLAVGDAVVERTPPPLPSLLIGLLGPMAKPLAIAGVIVVAALGGLATGRVARHRAVAAGAGFAGFAVLGGAALASDPRAGAVGAVVVVGTAAAVGAGALVVLLDRARPLPSPPGSGVTADPRDGGRLDRRGFARAALGMTAAGGLAAVGGTRLGGASKVEAARQAIALPAAVDPAPTIGSGAEVELDGLTPLFTPTEEFFRIDTAFRIPQVEVEGWRLRMTGLVDRALELTYDDLLAEDLVEVDATIACVSNEVGGHLIGTARWLGVPLGRLLDRAGPTAGAEQIVGRSVDGFTAGFPIGAAFDGRGSLVAVAMNDEPLPARHGFPARLIVPGLYGYVSATKWLDTIELTTWDGFDGYWVPRGWSKLGPVKVSSRIDVPAAGAEVDPGPVIVAGVAWAPARGIRAVEVRVGGGPWTLVSLGEEVSGAVWTQWWTAVSLESGTHTVEVRATDRDGVTQRGDPVPPAPDGAEGWHARRVRVR